MGETTFMKINGKYTARNKVVTPLHGTGRDPKLVRVRENSAEFTTCSKSGKVLRGAIGQLLNDAKDSGVARRLHKEISKVIHTDNTSVRGKRILKDGNFRLLIGFNFNIKARLRAAFNLKFATQMNRLTGELTINIPSFKPETIIKAPLGTTHFKIVSAGTAVDFSMYQAIKTETIISPLIPWDSNVTTPINAVHHVDANTPDTLFLVLGIQFYKVAGQWIDKVKMGNANCLCIVDAG